MFLIVFPREVHNGLLLTICFSFIACTSQRPFHDLFRIFWISKRPFLCSDFQNGKKLIVLNSIRKAADFGIVGLPIITCFGSVHNVVSTHVLLPCFRRLTLGSFVTTCRVRVKIICTDTRFVLFFSQAADVGAFYDYVLWKWEKFFDAIHPNFTRRVLSLIWASRYDSVTLNLYDVSVLCV